MLPFFCVVRLKPNDLFPGFRREEPHATALQSFTGLWYIPTIKRCASIIAVG